MPNPTAGEKVDQIVMERTENNPLLSSEAQQKKAYRALAVRLQSRIDRAMEVLRTSESFKIGNPTVSKALRILQEK